MAIAVIMPRQGQSVESCLIGKWYKSKGDKVSAGDILFTYETDKASFEEESKVDGVMLDVFFEEGDDVPCLVNVCVIGAEGESVEEFRPSGEAPAASSDTLIAKEDDNPRHVVPPDNPRHVVPPPSMEGGIARVSPRARRLAERTKADLSYAVPTGANGRIIERDVQAVLS